MDMASKRGADLAGWHPRRGRILLMIGLLLLGLAGWRFAGRAAFAGRAVIATAVIEDVAQGPFVAAEDVRRSFTVYAIVRYEVDGTLVRGRVALGGCRGGVCPARYERGDTVTVAYDPRRVSSVDLAGRVVGRHPLLDRWVLALLLVGVLLLVVAAGLRVAGR
jgi:hypothetical protein